MGGAIVAAILIELPRRVNLGDRRTTELVTSLLVAAFAAACVVGSLWAAGNWLDRLL